MTRTAGERVDEELEPAHVAGLSRLRTKKDKIRYACDHLPENPKTADVLAWLTRYGVVKNPKKERPGVSTEVTKWKRERGLSGDFPTLAGELLAELDKFTGDAAAQVVHSNGDGESAVLRQTEQVPTEHVPVSDEGVPTEQVPVSDEPVQDSENARPNKTHGALGFYLVSVLTMAVSANTSWEFFGTVLGITNPLERGVMFSVVELALIACGYGMAAGVRRDGRPGAPRFVAWGLCGLSAYMALVLSGPLAGLARVLLGPALGLVMLHLALGIEIRSQHQRVTTWARVGRELRERVLSRLGLGDDERDAIARTRDRAACRAARLALASGFTPFRRSRLQRALRTSGVAHDATARARMLAELTALRHADDLRNLSQSSPWSAPQS
ncbi:MAG TPA: hypothetical protein VJT49_06500 [Amycolatopsis sp.]|uniref:hypothetical protein n=1 Tax=Amycolatopsis sp. TaxID=37632 RepID=UPI002B49ABB7|nr:hypothetical protein [Amycolatopsis sp.]HKS44758.1 hypothetical protein [Amycolatopsis sp.]